MLSRFLSPRAMLVALLAVGLLLAAASSTLAVAPHGLFGPTGARATTDLAFQEMRETTSLRPDGSGEERVEFLVRNSGSSSIGAEDFLFRVNSTQYWGIEAFDEEGAIPHSIVVDGNEVRVTLQFRHALAPGDQYRYTFIINFPGLAQESGDEWTFGWGTYFPMEKFVRTVYLPGGGVLITATPPPDEQTADYVRWTRYALSEFELSLRYSLRALSDRELAEEFAPSFRLHPSDAYVPMRVDLALAHAECYPASGGQKQGCSTALLGGDWLNATTSYVDFQGYPGDALDDDNSSEHYYRANVRDQANAAPTVYARVWRDDDRTVIQYWLYYYYNSWGWQGGLGLGLGLHEGDWEMVQVVLDSEEEPLYAVFAQHFNLPAPYLNFNGASKKEWNDLARDTVNGDHPIVYPGLGSHASYFGPYPYLYAYDATASLATPLLRPAVYLLQPADSWISYRGKWGQPRRLLSFNGGPPSPGQQGQKWDTPLAWGEHSVPWDEVAGHNRGKVRASIFAPCNVGLQLGTGQRFGWVFHKYREEIAGGEYVVNETSGMRTAILHYTYKVNVSDYDIHITCPLGGTPSARQEAAPDLTVEFYDSGLDQLVTAHYTLPAAWTPETTIAAVALGDPSLALAVDRDNDGTTDAVVPPDEIITAPVQPPGALTYLPSILR